MGEAAPEPDKEQQALQAQVDQGQQPPEAPHNQHQRGRRTDS
jgi:hypothetical protein